MDDPKALEIFREVYAQTKAKGLKWEPVAQNGVYVSPVAGKYSLKAFSYSKQEGDDIPSIALYDEDDQMLVDITPEVDGVTTGQLRELYVMIVRQGDKKEEKVDEALTALRRNRPSQITDEDIPF